MESFYFLLIETYCLNADTLKEEHESHLYMSNILIFLILSFLKIKLNLIEHAELSSKISDIFAFALISEGE